MASVYLFPFFFSLLCVFLSFALHRICADKQAKKTIRINTILNLSLPFFLPPFLSPHAALWLGYFTTIIFIIFIIFIIVIRLPSVKLGSMQLRSHSFYLFYSFCPPDKYHCGSHSLDSLHLFPVSSPFSLQ